MRPQIQLNDSQNHKSGIRFHNNTCIIILANITKTVGF